VYNPPGGGVTTRPANARPVEPVPGREAGAADGARVARPPRHGPWTAGFVPPARPRGPRGPARRRSPPGGGRAAVANRVREVSGDAGVRLAGAAADALGVSGRATPEAGAAGPEGP